MQPVVRDVRLGGEVILPDDPGYDEARAVHNGMIDRDRRRSSAADRSMTSFQPDMLQRSD